MWHEDSMCHPSFGDLVSNKNGIAVWKTKLHKNLNLKFNYDLLKKGVNAKDDLVLVFKMSIISMLTKKMVRKGTFMFTRTWKKHGDI
ncbi:hypothetical protein [Gillisia limnaea]|uniref:Uncharacterized protein n=1 Tax=Gillisia limnaea (strain DSM 15749 / LMG 21470 / R-8282) TaxID=865937 RepID=H2BSU5_GILLR|nr:hypothetical protein [Gillisia limnaea]EHQ01475.1 hypothetical protein Gilli_0773 [Gillisia limnaea DSM 15749]